MSKNKIGKRFGVLTVLREAPCPPDPYGAFRTYRHRYWVCLCACGKECIVCGTRLFATNTKGCGCRKQQSPKYEGQKGQWLKSYKKGAAWRKLSWSLTDDEAFELGQGLCFYCGAAPRVYGSGQHMPYITNGLDRIDNVKGYELGNLVACCSVCNRLKSGKSTDEFISQCKKISDYQRGKE